jgi:hypothetical protein
MSGMLLMTLLTLLHLGTLHAYEKVLVAVVALGPFVVLAVVVLVLRRRDVAAERRAAAPGPARPGGGG